MPWIHRAGVQADFALIPNATLRDRRLSYAARGVLAEILSRPDDWQTSAAAMAALASKIGEGRYGMAAIFRELKAAGYVVYELDRGEGGRFVTRVHFYDNPEHVSAGRTGSRSAAGRSPATPDTAAPAAASPAAAAPDTAAPAAGTPPPGRRPAGTLAGRGSSRRPTTKTENEDRPDQDVVDARAPGREHARNPDDDGGLIGIAMDELAALRGGKPVQLEHAAEVVRLVLDGRQVQRPGPYLRRAIRQDPDRYVPKSSGPPRYRGGKFID